MELRDSLTSRRQVTPSARKARVDLNGRHRTANFVRSRFNRRPVLISHERAYMRARLRVCTCARDVCKASVRETREWPVIWRQSEAEGRQFWAPGPPLRGADSFRAANTSTPKIFAQTLSPLILLLFVLLFSLPRIPLSFVRSPALSRFLFIRERDEDLERTTHSGKGLYRNGSG